MIAGSRGHFVRAWRIHLQKIFYFDRSQMDPLVALRNAAGVATLLALGVAGKMPLEGLAASVGALQVTYTDASFGALQVSYSDAHGPYAQRARRMLASSLLCSLAVFAGGLAVRSPVVAGFIIVAWGFCAGLAVCLGENAESLGVISLVTFIIFGMQALTVDQAIVSGLLAVVGGLVQTGLALLLWPIRRYHPERHILSALYAQLADAATAPSASESLPVSEAMTSARAALAGISNETSLEAERYWSLLNQAERIRITLMTLHRLKGMLASDPVTEVLNEYLKSAAGLLAAVGESLSRDEPATRAGESLPVLESLAERLRTEQANSDVASAGAIRDARFQIDALTGQLRSALRTTTETTPAELKAFATRDALQPWQRRFASGLARLRANLTLRSSAFRHAIRLSLILALGELIARHLHNSRSYWLDMTIVLVLKEGFAATFSRGLLRIAGTFVGLVLATGLFHVMPHGIGLEVLAAGVLVFVLRWAGAGNYGVFIITVTALIVVMMSISGSSPMQLIVSRGEMTFLGGLLALGTYLVWPTWERNQLPEVLALMLDAYGHYFTAVASACIEGRSVHASEIGPLRTAARLARSNMEASVEKLRAEPGTTPETNTLVMALLVNSHRFVRATMALEAISPVTVPAGQEFQAFSSDVGKMLDSLAGALRANPGNLRDLPDLREDYHRLATSKQPGSSRPALFNEETDRITNSLNTLAEQVTKLLQLQSPIPS